MYYLDNLFEIGKSHQVCDDYSKSISTDNYKLLIVSDGCSASESTDIGSRILTICTENFIDKNYKYIFDMDKNEIGKAIIFDAQSSIKTLSLNQSVLDATLIFCFIMDNKYLIVKFGDGVSIIGNRNGVSEINYVNYKNEYVYYINYLYNKERNEIYLKKTDNEKKVINASYNKNTKEYNENESTSLSTIFESQIGNIKDIEYIIIGSDGLFSCSSDKSLADKCFLEFLDVKNSKGVFLKRRYHAWKKNINKNGLNHGDDISVAGISFYSNEEE